MGFSRQEYWSELPFPPPGDLPNPGIQLGSSALQADSLPLVPPGKPMLIWTQLKKGLPCGSDGKESACKARDLGLIPGLGRSPGGGNGYPLQYSGLENSMDCIAHVVFEIGRAHV